MVDIVRTTATNAVIEATNGIRNFLWLLLLDSVW